jgi:hypothetical protein
VQNASVSGITKPQVNEDLVAQLNQGTVIFNMVGHSHERQFAHENVFSLSNEVPLLENLNKLPFLIVASCAFGRFDGPAEKFIAEELLLKPDGGIIASFASARLSYPGPNGTLNNYLIWSLFRNPVNPARLGDAVRTAKNMYQNENTEKSRVGFKNPPPDVHDHRRESGFISRPQPGDGNRRTQFGAV